MPSRTNLLHSLPVVARALGRKYGLSVEVGGTRAFTDGNMIVLPSLPPDDPVARVVAYGFLDHEAAHVRLTDFEALSSAVSPLHKTLSNIFEDVRVEQEMGRMFPGCKINLESLIRTLAADQFFVMPTPEDPPAAILEAFLLFHLRAGVLGQTALVPFSRVAEALIRKRLPDELIDRLLKLISRVDQLTSTQDSMTLAGDVLELLKQEMERPSPPGKNRSEGDGQLDLKPSCLEQDAEDLADPSSPAAARDPQDLPAPQSPIQPEGQGNGSKPSGERANAGHGQPDESSPSIDGEPAQPAGRSPAQERSGGRKRQASPGRTLRRILQSTESELKRDFGELLAERLAREGERASKEGFGMAVAVRPSAAAPSAMAQEVTQQTRSLRVKLDGLIQASKLDRARLASTGLRIGTRELYRLTLSDPDVFLRFHRRRAINTAVQILLDKSGSMRHRLDIARRAALAVACALRSLTGTAVACAAFPAQGARNAVGVLPLTRFDERVTATASRYESLDAKGGTPLAEALWWCAAEILGRREERKIILVVTDGQPDDSDSARQIIQRCLESGIEMIGLGIEVQAVKTLFPDWCVVQDMQQLAPALFKVLERKLTRHSAESAYRPSRFTL
jgi:cobaltochelatase CobT